MSEGCNGWTNYETWAVNVWDMYLNMGEEYKDRYSHLPWQQMLCRVADAMKYDMEEYIGTYNIPPSFLSDIIGNAISRINWYELAENLMDDFKDEWGKPVDEQGEDEESSCEWWEDPEQVKWVKADEMRDFDR